MIKGLYMFRALLAHLQEVLHKRHLVYCLRVMSVGCTRIGVELVQPTDITRTKYTKCRLCRTSWGCASDARNILKNLILNKLNKKCITLVSLYWNIIILMGCWHILGCNSSLYFCKQCVQFLISSFRPVQYVVCNLLGCSPAYGV
jgi:hypothetical protein